MDTGSKIKKTISFKADNIASAVKQVQSYDNRTGSTSQDRSKYIRISERAEEMCSSASERP